MRKICYLREVEERDRELLFRWANDAETRSRSFSQAPITWEEHTAWFARMRADENCLHWILMASGEESGDAAREQQTGAVRPAGTVRAARDGDGGSYRISYSIAPECRGRGYGTIILELAKSWTAAFCPGCKYLYGEVKADNAASVRCFEKAGYEKHADAVEKVIRFYTDLAREPILYFRADAGAQIGSGHLMRCFTIADACRKLGLLPVFVTADAGAEAMVSERGYPCLVLKTDYRDMDAELDRLLPVLKDGAPVVLDSYFLTEQYVRTLREKGHPVAWMDDLSQIQPCVDLQINYNLYAGDPDTAAEESSHAGQPGAVKKQEEGGCLKLLGSAYAPVRPSFTRAGGSVPEHIRSVLVMTGGSDEAGAGIFFSRLLTQLLPEVGLSVVCGPYVRGKEALYALSGQNRNMEIIEGCSDLSDVMRRCDLAVAAAGSTLYELCASGLPCIVYYMADNQRMGAEAFACKTGAVNLGDIRLDHVREGVPEKLREALGQLASSSARQRLADDMHALVDGQGALRIAEKLRKLSYDSRAGAAR